MSNDTREEVAREFKIYGDSDNDAVDVQEIAILKDVSTLSDTSDTYRRTGTRYLTTDGRHVNKDDEDDSYQIVSLGDKKYYEKD